VGHARAGELVADREPGVTGADDNHVDAGWFGSAV
jgi:hypothetical protein